MQLHLAFAPPTAPLLRPRRVHAARPAPTPGAGIAASAAAPLPGASEQRDGAPTAAALRSPAVYALFERQRAHPLYDPSRASCAPPVRAYLQSVAAATPPSFARRADLLAASAAATPDGDGAAFAAAELVAVRSRAAVADGKRALLIADPNLLVAGRGRLGDGPAANACWRDLSALVRVAGYVCVAADGLSDAGARTVRDAYTHLDLQPALAVAALRAAEAAVVAAAPALAAECAVGSDDVARIASSAFCRVRDAIERGAV